MHPSKPDSEAFYMNITCEYQIYTLKTTLIIVLNRDALSIYLLCFKTYSHSLVLMLVAWSSRYPDVLACLS